jgi:hypothetical protein
MKKELYVLLAVIAIVAISNVVWDYEMRNAYSLLAFYGNLLFLHIDLLVVIYIITFIILCIIRLVKRLYARNRL